MVEIMRLLKIRQTFNRQSAQDLETDHSLNPQPPAGPDEHSSPKTGRGGGEGGAVSSRSFNLLNSMIYDLKVYVDLR